MISSVLQLIVFRRIPMTMDERIPLFVAIAIAPLLIAMSLDLTHLLAPFEDPTHIAISLAAIGTLFYVVDYYSRKSKGSYDWNIADALIVGILQMSALIPGCGLITGSLIASSFRNYRRDAAVKFAMFCATPILGVNAFSHLSRTPIHTEGLGMLTFWVCTAVTFLISLMAIGALIRQAEKKSFQIYIAYRAIAGVGVAAWLLWHRQT
jgi:undecaprenyl-diphosphatase